MKAWPEKDKGKTQQISLVNWKDILQATITSTAFRKKTLREKDCELFLQNTLTSYERYKMP